MKAATRAAERRQLLRDYMLLLRAACALCAIAARLRYYFTPLLRIRALRRVDAVYYYYATPFYAYAFD